VLRTVFPRIAKADFPPGRGLFVSRGKVVRVQLPLV
jgi:S-DNA-T family DNA segregation ATPase FtsK/SpoIIIE